VHLLTYISSKTFGHDLGLSCCFRQWRADSHCRMLHGYAMAIHLEFEADTLDDKNWVVDFGSMKDLKSMFEQLFDHTLIVAEDDPDLDTFVDLNDKNIANVVFVENTGCEAFAKLIFDITDGWLEQEAYTPRVRMRSVTVSEHGANSATYAGGR